MLQGLVKSVPSGDTLVIVNMVKKVGPPQEKTITLAGISAPRLGSKKDDGTTVGEEAFAWESREFLRKLVIGEVVSFRIEHKLETTGREYAMVLFGEKNLSIELLKNGLAKLRQQQNPQLVQAEEEGKIAQLGMYNPKAKHPIRQLISSRDAGYDSAAVLKSLKGKSQQAVVEAVINANLIRVVLIPQSATGKFHDIVISLSGIRCPAMRAQTGNPEPFAAEAKFFSERKILHRDVRVILESSDEHSLCGSIVTKEGNLSVLLARNGFASILSWSLASSSAAEQIKDAEHQAKLERLRIWANYKPQQTSHFHAHVVEVISGDMVCVVDDNDQEQTINISSVRAPKLKEDGKFDPLGFAAKESLRKSLVGKSVDVEVEYSKDFESTTGGAGGGNNSTEGNKITRKYATLTLSNGGKNAILGLIEAGLCEVVKHKANEPRSKDYDDLVLAQAAAQEAKKGKWGTGKVDLPAAVHFNDLSGDANKAKAFMPTFTREPNQNALVDFVSNGGRFKVRVMKHTCIFPFGLNCIYVPACARKDRGTAEEPFGNEALAFARKHICQREVQIEIESCDRIGTFFGQVKLSNGQLFSVELLKKGYAYLQEGVERNKYYSELLKAQNYAKQSLLGVWKDHHKMEEQKQAQQAQQQPQSELQSTVKKYLRVNISEVSSGSLFYIKEKSALSLEKQVEDCVKTSSSVQNVRVGSILAAEFSADQSWYRARVTKVLPNGQADLKFIDFGNSEVVQVSKLKTLNQQLASYAPQALEATLSFLNVPDLSKEFGREAAEFFASIVLGKEMIARVDSISGQVLNISLFDAESNVCINTEMLKEGLAKVSKNTKGIDAELLEELLKAQDEAKRSHLHIWEYGDVSSDEEEVPTNKKGKRGGNSK